MVQVALGLGIPAVLGVAFGSATDAADYRPSAACLVVVVVLAVIGLFSIIGTVMSAAWWLFKTAVILVGLVVLAALAWRLLIGKPDRAT